MVQVALTLQRKSLDAPDETLELPLARGEVAAVGGVTVTRATLAPGWRWLEHLQPIVGTPSCQEPHIGYVLAGRMKVAMDDGSELELGAGDAFTIPPGHDVWVVGDEPAVTLDFTFDSTEGAPTD